MAFSIKSFMLAACVVASVNVTASGEYKLPQAHTSIAENEVTASGGLAVTFADEAMAEARANANFAMTMAAEEPASDSPLAMAMVDYASKFIGTRYRSGASGPSAFDCSGFTSYVYKNFGITLSRSSRTQYLEGEKVSINNVKPGDLLFFSSRGSGRGRVGHVAMVVSVDNEAGTCRFIHASTKRGVVYQNFPDGGYYQRNFIGARRIIGTDAAPDNELVMTAR